MMKSKEEQQVDEILMDYAKIIEKAQAAEMDKDCDPAFDFDASLKELKESGLFREEKKRTPKKILQLAAMVMLAVCVTAAVFPTAEVHAWAIWTFNAIFGGDDTHTTIDPVDENDYLQYYVSEVPNGFTRLEKQNTGGRERIVYVNAEDKFISFEQLKKEMYKSDADTENREDRYERIGEFEVLVSESEEDWTFTIVSDDIDTVVLVHTDAGFEVGKQFIENLVRNKN